MNSFPPPTRKFWKMCPGGFLFLNTDHSLHSPPHPSLFESGKGSWTIERMRIWGPHPHFSLASPFLCSGNTVRLLWIPWEPLKIQVFFLEGTFPLFNAPHVYVHYFILFISFHLFYCFIWLCLAVLPHALISNRPFLSLVDPPSVYVSYSGAPILYTYVLPLKYSSSCKCSALLLTLRIQLTLESSISLSPVWYTLKGIAWPVRIADTCISNRLS